MHLESLEDHTVRLGRRAFDFVRGETIHTENSYKYSPQEFTALAECSGWNTARTWTDENQLFAVYLLRNALD
jgi:uncharacterized SAM-dependent methyltransferase